MNGNQVEINDNTKIECNLSISVNCLFQANNTKFENSNLQISDRLCSQWRQRENSNGSLATWNYNIFDKNSIQNKVNSNRFTQKSSINYVDETISSSDGSVSPDFLYSLPQYKNLLSVYDVDRKTFEIKKTSKIYLFKQKNLTQEIYSIFQRLQNW